MLVTVLYMILLKVTPTMGREAGLNLNLSQMRMARMVGELEMDRTLAVDNGVATGRGHRIRGRTRTTMGMAGRGPGREHGRNHTTMITTGVTLGVASGTMGGDGSPSPGIGRGSLGREGVAMTGTPRRSGPT